MIVRRMTAAAAGVALAAAVAGPAMAKSTTTVNLDPATVQTLGVANIKPSAVSPAKLKGNKITFPAKFKGKTVTHKGGLKLAAGDKFLTIQNISINWKSGKADADVNQSLTGSPLPIKGILVFKGGKKTKTSWKNAKVSLASKVDVPGFGMQNTSFVLAAVYGLDEALINQVLPAPISIGTATIKK